MQETGSVLGIDVGFSLTRKSSAVCRLDWDRTSIKWTIKRFRALPKEREDTIRDVSGGAQLLAAALDGPLRRGFGIIGAYRTAERMLTRRLKRRIGKPGQASTPVGKNLNSAANDCAKAVLEICSLAETRHETRIYDRAIVEAFPSSFLGLLLEDPGKIAASRKDRSDKFFIAAAQTMIKLLQHLLPGRTLCKSLTDVTNHDERAALVCALTALGVVAEDFTAVGDENGWIILPPPKFVRDWAWKELRANADEEQQGYLYQTPSE